MASWKLRILCDRRRNPISAPEDIQDQRSINPASTRQRLLPALMLVLLLPALAHAQDTFSAGDSPQTNTSSTSSDTFSTSCIQALKPNIWKQLGVNPLTCHPQSMGQDSQGQCTLKGATLVAHQGTMCYYCVPQVPPGTLYIPMDQVQNASVQGYLCGESPVDPGCMSVCSKEFSTTTTYVPPSTQPTTTTGGGVPPLAASTATDPCHPVYNLSTAAGQAAMQANAAKDAAACNGERCAHNPDLDVCKNQPLSEPEGQPLAQRTAVEDLPCFSPQGGLYFSSEQATSIQNAIASANAMLLKAKTFTDKTTWDSGTVAIATKYYGNASATTQATLRKDINGALTLLDTLAVDNQTITMSSPSDWIKFPLVALADAFVYRDWPSATSPRVFLTSIYFLNPATGADSQASVLVHEMSHYTLGGATQDIAYTEGACNLLVSVAANIPSVNAQLKKLNMKPIAPPNPLQNADSFKYFVYYTSQQK